MYQTKIINGGGGGGSGGGGGGGAAAAAATTTNSVINTIHFSYLNGIRLMTEVYGCFLGDNTHSIGRPCRAISLMGCVCVDTPSAWLLTSPAQCMTNGLALLALARYC